MTNERKLAVISLLLTIGGVLISFAVVSAGYLLGFNGMMLGYALLFVAELTAIVLGLMSTERLGRVSAGVAGLIIAASLSFMP